MKKILSGLIVFMLMSVAAVAQEQPGLKAGIKASDFQAITHRGEQVRLSDMNKNGPVILVFYRGGWCIYCNRQLQDYQKHLADFQEYDASIMAVSVDLQEYAAKSVEEQELGFTVVSNPEADLLKLYNLVYQVPDDLAKKYKEEYNIDLEASSGRDDHVISIPATYIIDRSGTIAFAFADRDYKKRKSAEELLSVLNTLAQ